MSSTKEEKFILESYRQACKASQEHPQEAVLHRYQIGQKVGMGERGVNASFKLFVRANFVHPLEEGNFSLTDGGLRLAKTLLSDNAS